MIIEALQRFFHIDLQGEQVQLIIVEKEGTYDVHTSPTNFGRGDESWMSIRCNIDDEVEITWHRGTKQVVHMERISMMNMDAVREDGEERLQFVISRLSSRMIEVQLKPFFSVNMGLYWEVCDECD